jgi:hypothetical protein
MRDTMGGCHSLSSKFVVGFTHCNHDTYNGALVLLTERLCRHHIILITSGNL